ncbi:3-dehydroquinate synthase [Algibacillus agarilyticus]|uniref:3-dehydroquinate synthase n=1 Tax=Algibacillus agarilyticus TaxID=2234133 RepID=UPI000DD0571F|nr:3-dehydroquinate synthase [Algibacillus agarilyticus]
MSDRFLNTQRIKQSFNVSFDYDVIFTRHVFSPANQELIQLINNHQDSPKLLVVIDQGVLDTTPYLIDHITDYCKLHSLNLLPIMSVVGGEACKQDPQVIERVYQAVEQHEIDRHSYILVIGGGAVVDAVGYAAATAHRGIRLIRMPSTVLGQNDAGVGVKNAVNYHKRKNYIGTFSTPFAVINDFSLLNTLTARDKRAGIAEAIKVALIKDADFFAELCQQQHELSEFANRAMENMIIKGASWHLNHIATSGDAFEAGSARPLDFGHWSAHKLEELSNNELRHGEAVAIGIAIDSIYSNLLGQITSHELLSILGLLTTLGFELSPPVLDELDVAKALAEFKEHLGGRLCITLLNSIGEGVEVSDINVGMMVDAIAQLKVLPHSLTLKKRA